MSKLTIEQWLEELTPIQVDVSGKPTFELRVDLAALSLSLYTATEDALKEAKTEEERVAAYTRLLSRLVKEWDFDDPVSPENLARLGERTLMLAWRALDEALVPNAGSSAGSKSGSPDGASELAPGGTEP